MLLPTPLEGLRLLSSVVEETEGAAEGGRGGDVGLAGVEDAAEVGDTAVGVEAGNRVGGTDVILFLFPEDPDGGVAEAAVPDFCQVGRVALPPGRAVPLPSAAAFGSVGGSVVMVVALTETGWREGEGTLVVEALSFFALVGGGKRGWRWR